MPSQRENKLWREYDKLAFILSGVVILVFGIAYFFIGSTAPIPGSFWDVARGLGLDVIANLIPTSVLFAGSYVVLRHMQELRSEHEREVIAEEISRKVAEAVLQGLVQIAAQIPTDAADIGTRRPMTDEERQQHLLQQELEITDKHFDEHSDPQRIVVRFTNRGNSVFHVDKVRFSATRELPESALDTSYRKENGGRYLVIPFSPEDAEVLPGNTFTVELRLAQAWRAEEINRLAGSWGYLRPIVTYNGKQMQLFYGI